jgi:hypothetical protein
MRLRCECYSLLDPPGKQTAEDSTANYSLLRAEVFQTILLFALFLRFMTGKLMHAAILG